MIVELAWCVVLRVGASWVCPRLARGSGGRRASPQPSDTGGDTQPYFSWVFTRDLKVASASLRLNAFLDFPAFLHIRPCKDRHRDTGREGVRRRGWTRDLPALSCLPKKAVVKPFPFLSGCMSEGNQTD